MDSSKYFRVKKYFDDLLPMLNGYLQSAEKDDIGLYLNVGEEGLAFESLLFFVLSDKLPLTKQSFHLISCLHDELGMEFDNQQEYVNLLTDA